ncbi:MAG TPA: hypothetical protein VFS21_26010 [Roseiflexaceae bacterium]|nr:hypothetical protein [Roseiflexaceae bacterium]
MNGARPPTPAGFWELLLDQIDPHAPAPAVDLSARVLCGRCLGLRRLSRGMPLLALSGRIGVPADTLALLEAGVASTRHLTDGARLRLARALAEQPGEAGWLASVVAAALGESVADLAGLLDQVRLDLAPYADAVPEVAEAPPVSLPAGAAQDERLRLLRCDSVAVTILLLLHKQASRPLDTFHIWQTLSAERRVSSMADVAYKLKELLDQGWIVASGIGGARVFALTGQGERACQELRFGSGFSDQPLPSGTG